MTAEIVIMNRIGIALAADSAVTLGIEKIYTSADKLFQLSEISPVGIMVYGNADLIGVPWETIIKLFRKKLGNQVFEELSEYAKEFCKFICDENILAPDLQRRFVDEFAGSYFTFFREDLLRLRLAEAMQEKEVSEDEIAGIIVELVDQELENTKTFDYCDDLGDEFKINVKNMYSNTIEEAIKIVFGAMPISGETKSKMIDLVCEFLVRKRDGITESGIVIAGFGERELFPSLIEFSIKGVAANTLLFAKNREAKIGEDSLSYIAPFAQREMVHTFMEGIDPDLKEIIYESTTDLFNGAVAAIIEKVKEEDQDIGLKIESEIKDKVEPMINELIGSWDRKRELEYSGPIMDVVLSLPKDELGAMAEALVNLTKFKRRVSRQQETVGGPIDVALITKGDGFIWVKRKHYFEAELNPRFFRKYYNYFRKEQKP
jgi:hypothetical protein